MSFLSTETSRELRGEAGRKPDDDEVVDMSVEGPAVSGKPQKKAKKNITSDAINNRNPTRRPVLTAVE